MLRRSIRTLIVIALTLGLTAFFLRNAQLDHVLNAVWLARLDMLVVCTVFTVLSYVIRIERWRGLLRPVGSVSFLTAGMATVIGFTANALLPGRVGQDLRPFFGLRSRAVFRPRIWGRFSAPDLVPFFGAPEQFSLNSF